VSGEHDKVNGQEEAGMNDDSRADLQGADAEGVDMEGADGASAEAAGQSGGTDSQDDKDWKAEAEAFKAQALEAREQVLRAQAEMQNIRRRAEQDVEKAHKFALEKFARELVPVIDSLEKAIEAEKELGNASTPLREGVEMTLSMFLNGIKKFNLEQVDPVGQPFDPSLHEAMSMVEAPDTEPNTVIAAMQKGYTLHGRLIRPAMVMVAKGGQSGSGGQNSTKVDEQA